MQGVMDVFVETRLLDEYSSLARNMRQDAMKENNREEAQFYQLLARETRVDRETARHEGYALVSLIIHAESSVSGGAVVYLLINDFRSSPTEPGTENDKNARRRQVHVMPDVGVSRRRATSAPPNPSRRQDNRAKAYV